MELSSEGEDGVDRSLSGAIGVGILVLCTIVGLLMLAPKGDATES